jgi:cyanophycinase-like exopeptidase|mmetsp:Transcript_67878/g.113764  ORF Transcript_67878/g.113764 Transcript_67878/m.113764 type:complete len:92 (-) Transcript_67878:1353-1628(-)
MLDHFSRVSQHQKLLIDLSTAPNLHDLPGLRVLSQHKSQHKATLWLVSEAAFNNKFCIGNKSQEAGRPHAAKDGRMPVSLRLFVGLLPKYI